MKKSITFCFPYKEVSGVPVLFLNLAEFLSKEFDVFIVDYVDGYMSTNLKKSSRVNLIEFSDGESVLIQNTTLIIQSILPKSIRPELIISNNVKILFWNLYPDNFFPTVFPFNFIINFCKNNLQFYHQIIKLFYSSYFSNLRNFVELIYSRDSLIFMDSSNLERTNEILHLNLQNKEFLPIFSCGNDNDFLINNKSKNELNISWIGRICDFKVYILKYIIEKISEYASINKIKIKFHIIGIGEMMHVINNLEVENDYFNVLRIGIVPKDKLDKYLINNIDMNVAMGTSALESARLAIPTILLDFSEKEIKKDYVFRWLHDTKEFDLGHIITNIDCKKGNESIDNMINEYLSDAEILKNKVYNYFYNYHSIQSVSDKFKRIINRNLISNGEIDPLYFRKSIIRKLYEYKRYKIWKK